MKNKLKRYSENKLNNLIIENGKKLFKKTKGNWNKLFNNNNPIYLELGCGNGEYTVQNSINNPDINYIGIDIKGSRIWKGANILNKLNSKNAFFLRIQIEEIDNHFKSNEVDEILITFPDPRPKKRDTKKRLTNIKFLIIYHSLLKNNGLFKLKTDDLKFFEFSYDCIKKSNFKNIKSTINLYKSKEHEEIKIIKTKYEKKFIDQGKIIKYLRCEKSDFD